MMKINPKLLKVLAGIRKYTVIGLTNNKVSVQIRTLVEDTSHVPISKRRTEISTNTRGQILVLCISRSITESVAILAITGIHVQLGIQNFLLTEISKLRPVVIKTVKLLELSGHTLHVSSTGKNRHNTDDIAVFLKTTLKRVALLDADSLTRQITLRRSVITFSSLRSLLNVRNNNRGLAAAEILGTLEASIGRLYTEKAEKLLNVTLTATSGFLEKFLRTDRSAEFIDSSGRNLRKISRTITTQQNTSITNFQRLRLRCRRTISHKVSTSIDITARIRVLSLCINLTAFNSHRSIAMERQRNIFTSLGPGQGSGKIVLFPCTTMQLQKINGIQFSHSLATTFAVLNINRVLQILITVVFIPDKMISTERKCINLDLISGRASTNAVHAHNIQLIRAGNNLSRTDRETKIISQRARSEKLHTLLYTLKLRVILSTAKIQSRVGGNFIRMLLSTAVLTSSNEILPTFPDKAVRNKEKVCVDVHPMHNRGSQRSETHKHLGIQLPHVTGNNLLTQDRDKVTHIHRKFDIVGEVKNISFRHLDSNRIEKIKAHKSRF